MEHIDETGARHSQKERNWDRIQLHSDYPANALKSRKFLQDKQPVTGNAIIPDHSFHRHQVILTCLISQTH